MLKVEVVDETCEEGEALIFTFPHDHDKAQIISAIDVLYPTNTCITMYIEEQS